MIKQRFFLILDASESSIQCLSFNSASYLEEWENLLGYWRISTENKLAVTWFGSTFFVSFSFRVTRMPAVFTGRANYLYIIEVSRSEIEQVSTIWATGRGKSYVVVAGGPVMKLLFIFFCSSCASSSNLQFVSLPSSWQILQTVRL